MLGCVHVSSIPLREKACGRRSKLFFLSTLSPSKHISVKHLRARNSGCPSPANVMRDLELEWGCFEIQPSCSSLTHPMYNDWPLQRYDQFDAFEPITGKWAVYDKTQQKSSSVYITVPFPFHYSSITTEIHQKAMKIKGQFRKTQTWPKFPKASWHQGHFSTLTQNKLILVLLRGFWEPGTRLGLCWPVGNSQLKM